MKRILSSILILALVCALSAACIFGVQSENDTAPEDGYFFEISNPYSEVDWDNWGCYKAATHVHTVRSDGNVEIDDMIENYYALGYDALALTDHGTVNYGWTNKQSRLVLYDYQWFVHGKLDPLSESRYTQITTGSDRGGRGMTEIPLGIELNAASINKCHVNSYFADCGHGDLEISEKWPESAIKKSQNAGGICHINHVGEWAEANNDISVYDSAFISKYANLFMKYSACVGMELVNTTDNRTRNDRYLYDETLKITAAQGRNIWGFCEDDSHDPEDCGNNANYFMMPENNAANIRSAMENGTFFACSKNAKTAAELGDGFAASGAFPLITRIDVDEENAQILISAENAHSIKLVADGAVIDAKTINSDSDIICFDLNDYEDKIGSYIRFYVLGNGGICYAQPMLIKKERIVKPGINAALKETESGSTIVCSVPASNCCDDPVMLIAAQYQNGKMISLKSSEVFRTGQGLSAISFIFPKLPSTSFEVLLVNSNSFIPLCTNAILK